MNPLLAFLGAAAGKVAAFLGATAANMALAAVPLLAMFLVIWYCERRQGSDTARYVRRSFGQDLAYTVFYNSGAFGLLGASLIYDAVRNQLGFLQLGLLEGLPIVLVGVLYVLLADLTNYWVHRAEHAIPFLWQFHSTHHASEEISFLTAYRVHPISKLLYGVSEVVLLILLGVPPTWWFPFTVVRAFLASVQHSDLDWSYGPLYPVVVSPIFHRLHHSRDRRDFDSNFSQLFGVWDHLFGTVNPSRTPPVAVGVEGLPAEPTLLGQFWEPFRGLVRARAAREIATEPSPGGHGGGEDRPLVASSLLKTRKESHGTR